MREAKDFSSLIGLVRFANVDVQPATELTAMVGHLLAHEGVIAQRYRIIRPIGGGGFGRVYEAEHRVTGRRCALKIMSPHGAFSADARGRFVRESRLAARVRSEFIVDVLDAGVCEASDLPFMAMELLEGEDLGQHAARHGTFDARRVVHYLLHAASALDAAHEGGIVHRDLKPSNMFVTRREDGSALVKVLDFGIAKQMNADATQSSTAGLGTPIYMAPEQFGNQPITAAVDVHALGMIAFRLLVGHHYYELERAESGNNNYALGALLMKGVPEPSSARAARYGATCDDRFDRWFAQATQRDPGARFDSAGGAIRALAEALDVDLASLPRVLEEPSELAAPPEETWRTESLESTPADLPSTKLTLSAKATAAPDSRWTYRGAAALVALALLGTTAYFVRTSRTEAAAAAVPSASDSPRPAATLTAAPFTPEPPTTTTSASSAPGRASPRLVSSPPPPRRPPSSTAPEPPADADLWTRE